MGCRLTLALIGDPARMQGDALPEDVWVVPYEERPSVDLDASEAETLGDLFRKAAPELGLGGRQRFSASHFGFYRPQDEAEMPRVSSLLTVVGEDGRATWARRASDVTYGEVLHTHAAGGLVGDPRRVYIALIPPVGDGVLPDWGSLLHGLEALKSVLDYVLAFAGGAELIRRLAGPLQRGQKVLEAHQANWQDRGADPYVFDQWLDDRPWLPADLVPMLGCTEDDARSVLWAFGFAEGERGLWIRGGSEDARFMDATKRAIINTAFQMANDETFERYLRRRVEQYAETGKAPPFDWQEFDWLNL